MMRLLRASVLISTLSLLLFLGTSSSVFAAERCTGTKDVCEAGGTKVCTLVNPNLPQSNVWNCTETATIDIQDHQSELAGYYEECKAIPGATNFGTGACIIRDKNGVKTECDRVLFNGQPGQDWKCKFTALSDNSRIEIDPNWALGTNQKLFNSEGIKVGEGSFGGFFDDRTTGDLTASDEVDTTGQGCGVDFLCALGKLPGILLSAIAYAILVLSTFILFLAGTVFNWVVIRTVFQFATYFGTSEGMLVAWTVLRDIANIALLFGFVFIGVATILNTQSVEGYSAKKALPRLIIFAVLLNFSLFATQGIIDVANGFASIFSTYAGQECGQAGGDGTTGQGNEECANVGISGKIMSAAGMNHMFSTDGMSGTWEKPYSTAAMLIILALLVSITAMVLFAASIMLVIRVVVLSLLMVTSPIGFAGLAIPSLNKIAMDWWHKLINQAFFAPLYLLMVFISLKLVDGLQSGGASIPQALTADVSGGGTIAGNMQVVVVYAIVIGFMVGSLMVAQKMGAAGAGFATKTAGGLAFGAQGFVARRTMGRLSGAMANSKTLSRFAEKNPGLGRLAYAGLNKGATASFSARNMVGGAMKGAGAKLDIGTANKTVAHGYHGIEEKAEKERLEFAKKFTDREETVKERDARVAGEEAKLRDESGKNAQTVLDAEGGVTNSSSKQATAKQNLKTKEDALQAKREAFAKAGRIGDPTAAAELETDRAGIVQAQEELAVAGNELESASARLAAAEAAREEIGNRVIDRTTKGTIKARDRQIAYAQAMEQENKKILGSAIPNVFTAGGHGNHAAAAKILKDANKDDTERAFDQLRAAMKKKEEAEKKAEAPPTHSPAAPGGPAPADPHTH